MNALLRSMGAAALCVAAISAQAPEAAAALARAQVLENQEADLAAAEQAYRALLADGKAAAVHGEAALRLGTLLWRLDRRDAAKPFLERAATAGGDLGVQATAVLQGQDPQGKQAEERLAQARALVDRIVDYEWLLMEPRPGTEGEQATLQSLRTELRGLGEAAATALVEHMGRLQGLQEAQLRTDKGVPVPQLALVRLLWEIGGKAASEHLARAADDPSVALRRFLTMPLRQVKVARDLEPVLVRWTRDPDPTNEVWRNVVPALAKLPLDGLLPLLQEAHPGPRGAAWSALATRWDVLANDERERLAAATADPLRRSLHDADGRVARSAWHLLAAFAQWGPPAGRALFLAEAASCPDDLMIQQLSQPLIGDDELLQALAAAARALGPKDPTRSRPPMTFVSTVLHMHQPMWSEAGVDAVLTLLELGYARHSNPDERWLEHAVGRASPAQLVRLIPLLPQAPLVDRTLRRLAQTPLPAEAFPAVRDLLTACLDARIPTWRTQPQFADRIGPDGKPYRVQTPIPAVQALLPALAQTRAPAAAAWLVEQATSRPTLVGTFAQTLVAMSHDGVAEAGTGLRTLLVWPGGADGQLHPEERSRIVAELARTGDAAAIPLLPRAYALGLQRLTVFAGRFGYSAAGIGWLGEWKNQGSASPTGPWHGYRDPDLVGAWRTLLDSPAADQVWSELSGGSVAQMPTATTQSSPSTREFEIPLAVLPLLCDHLPPRWAEATGDQERRELQDGVLRAFGRLSRANIAADAALADALRQLLRADDGELAMAAVSYLPDDVCNLLADDARAVLRRTPFKWLVGRLLRAGIELPLDDWRLLLANRERNGLREALKALPPQPGAALRREVEAALAHEDATVRVAACQAMQRLHGADAVPTLLPLLQDPDDDVRKAARASLDQLREEHERRTYWAQAGTGVDVSPAAAAAKLLLQARGGEAKEQRLLALQSLGVLGSPETLPHLIELTKDADAEVAAAARTAIARIHAKAGAPAPAGR